MTSLHLIAQNKCSNLESGKSFTNHDKCEESVKHPMFTENHLELGYLYVCLLEFSLLFARIMKNEICTTK